MRKRWLWILALSLMFASGIYLIDAYLDRDPDDHPLPAANGAVSQVSGISSHARQIFAAGQARGNNARVFVNVGDSITYTWAYLRDFNSDYDLGEYTYLQAALDFFTGPNGFGESPFWSEPIAAYAGWTSADVLTPGHALNEACRDDEAPLVCEYRINKPAVALIMLGTNDAGGGVPVATFTANMQTIIDLSLEQGIIPVISTIPPMIRRDETIHAYNDAIRYLAQTNAIPLWDYYAALIDLPDRGLSADGIHPSRAPDKLDAYFDAEHLQYGFNVRNLGALQVLAALRIGVNHFSD
ncbi:MAG: hypothetical protein JXA10_11670 [Anaerolineae bacterium]|nr:hypothetical protein [Anaerolineae bacterium]